MVLYVKVYGIKMADRIHWKRLESALKRYGKKVVDDMTDLLTKQDHIDTGKLRDSIKAYVEGSDEAKLALYITYYPAEYGQYAYRWFEKSSIRTITTTTTIKGKKRTIRKKVGTRPESPLFTEPMIDLIDFNDELTDLMTQASRADLEETIYNHIKNK